MTWETESLGNLLAPAGKDRAGKQYLPVLSITMHSGLVDQSTKFKKRVASKDTSSYRVVYTNELVVGFPIDEGVLGFQTKYPAAVVSPAYGIWKLKRPAETHIPFIEGYLRSSEARRIYANKMRGAVARRRSINREDFLAIEIPFPPLDEQKRIADVLNKADALHRQRQESLQLTEKLLQSVFIDMFGDPVENPSGWERIPFKELLDNIDSGWSPKCLDRVAEEDEWGVLKLGAVTSCEYRWQENKALPAFEVPRTEHEVKAGDILFSRKNTYALVAACVFVKATREKLLLPDLIFRFRLKENSQIAPQYLQRLLITPSKRKSIQQLAGGAAGSMPNISKAKLREVLIERPPFELQTQFVERIAAIEIILSAQNDALLQSEAFLRYLQQRAFRGELDLSRLKLDAEVESLAVTPAREPIAIQGRYKRPGSFIAPPDIEAHMMALEAKLELGPGDSIPWSEDYFKYRTVSQVLQPPFSFSEIWEAVEYDMEEVGYEKVKAKVFEYVEGGILEQEFDENRKEIVFRPSP